MIQVAKQTIDRSSLEYGHVCLRVESPNSVYKEVELNIFGNHYTILVCEDSQSSWMREGGMEITSTIPLLPEVLGGFLSLERRRSYEWLVQTVQEMTSEAWKRGKAATLG
ncbi:hypothetical protein AAC387_Pa11g0434 [Persea americana]